MHQIATIFGRLWLLMRLLLQDDTKCVGTAEVLFFSHDADKGELICGGQRFGKLLDPLNLILTRRGLTCLDFSSPGSRLTGKKTWAETRGIGRMFAMAILKDIFALRAEKDYFQEKYFQSLFLRTSAKAVFTIGGLASLRRAAQRLGIPCVEVLHGKGYVSNPLTALASAPLPSHVLSFDSTSSLWLKNHYESRIEILNTRDYWREHFIYNPKPDDVSASSWAGVSFASDLAHSSRPIKPLISLTWGYERKINGDPSPYPNALFPQELLAAIRGVGDLGFWYFRLHPVQMTGRARAYRQQRRYMSELEAKLQNMDFINASKVPLPFLLRRVTHNITTSSSACYEAAEFGIPTLALDPSLRNPGPGAQTFADLVDEGYLTKGLPDARQIASWLSNTGMKNPRGMTNFGVPIATHLENLDLVAAEDKS